MNYLEKILYFLIGSIITIFLILFFIPLNKIFNEHMGWVTILSILVVILVFLFTRKYDKNKIDKQHNLLIQTLKERILSIDEDCKGYRKEIINCSVPLYKIKRIETILYTSIKIKKIKNLITKINDKVDLINSYLSHIIKEWNGHLTNVKFNNSSNNCDLKDITKNEWEKFRKKSFLYIYYKKKIEGTLIDLEQFIKDFLEKERDSLNDSTPN